MSELYDDLTSNLFDQLHMNPESDSSALMMFPSVHKGTNQYVEGDADQICNWLTVFIVMTFVWLLVTLLTDWSSVFYRKAIIYKRRVDDELEKRRNTHNKSFTSGTTSNVHEVESNSSRNKYANNNFDGGANWDTN
jgi:hypothetical protein